MAIDPTSDLIIDDGGRDDDDGAQDFGDAAEDTSSIQADGNPGGPGSGDR